MWAACELSSSRLDVHRNKADRRAGSQLTLSSMAEMITGYPLFRGRDNADQLVQIMKIVGTPSDATLQQIKMNSVG